MSDTGVSQPVVWRATSKVWALVLMVTVLMWASYHHALGNLVGYWEKWEEYSYGYFIPVISLFLIWRQKDKLEQMRLDGSWAGVVVVIAGAGLLIAGELGAVALLTQYSFVVVVAGLALSFIGWPGFRIVFFPLLILLFMIPIPTFLFHGLSAQLQLASSLLGVAVIRLFDISVYLEGNVIDLGGYKLQVVEACSGLRYLFPLMVLGFIAAYFFKQTFWKRLVIFLSTIPITVFMNSFRIGVIGVLVEYKGPSMAEGFLHDFEGWVVFMGCVALLILEMALLSRIGPDRKSLSATFGIEFPEPSPSDAKILSRKIPAEFILSVAVIAVLVGYLQFVGERTQIIPSRAEFSEFPLKLEGWEGRKDRLEQIYIDELNLDDHVLIDFTDDKYQTVNFYAAYYNDQNKSKAIHSPRTCLPGGGWIIDSITQETVGDIAFNGTPLMVNRVVIRKEDYRQLVYYWFQQRGRVITSEYLVKWYILWDALIRRRTDGALVRLTTMVPPGEDVLHADSRLISLANEVSSFLTNYIPD